MDRCRKHPIRHHPGLRYASVLCAVAILNVLPGCVTTNNAAPEMAWVRTDGRRIADDPALLQQGKTDIILCHADLDAGSANETARTCMAREATLWFRRIRRKTCVRRMLPPLNGRTLLTDDAACEEPRLQLRLRGLGISKQREASFFAGVCFARYCGSVG